MPRPSSGCPMRASEWIKVLSVTARKRVTRWDWTLTMGSSVSTTDSRNTTGEGTHVLPTVVIPAGRIRPNPGKGPVYGGGVALENTDSPCADMQICAAKQCCQTIHHISTTISLFDPMLSNIKQRKGYESLGKRSLL